MTLLLSMLLAVAAADQEIPVAFVVNEGAVVIDFAGPWEVFSNVPGKFRLYTVAESRKPVTVGGGMKIIPNYDYASAPQPKLIVIPAANEPSQRTLDWIRKASKGTDLTMSVCTGAFILAATGLLDGKSATTHHAGFNEFAMDFPKVTLKRGARFVDEGKVASAGGLTSGIDLALHVVDRMFGREVAQKTAYQLEWQGSGWLDASSNSQYAKRPVAAPGKAICPVCEMEVDPSTSPHSDYKGTTYSFCMESHKALFDSAPEKFAASPKP
jgi:transcriptional regulator GlxA family with amidase domain/YHS domain-containing protein